MTITPLDSIIPGTNVFHDDPYHMGISIHHGGVLNIGQRVLVMYDHPERYVVVVNEVTGERVKITWNN